MNSISNEIYLQRIYKKEDIIKLCNVQTIYLYNRLKNDDILNNKIIFNKLVDNNFTLTFIRHKDCKLDLYGLNISFNPLLYINEYGLPSVIEVLPICTNINFEYETPAFFDDYEKFIEKVLSISDNMLSEL
jgi:hypothetical protein